VIGTPEFMSPEQLVGDPVDARSDLYSLGCIAYLMLTGTPAADAPSRDAMLKRRLREQPRGPRALRLDVPPELDAIVSKLLAPAPEKRFQSAAELRHELSRLRLHDHTTLRERRSPPPSMWTRPRAATALALSVALVAAAVLYSTREPAPAIVDDVPELAPVVVTSTGDGAAAVDTSMLRTADRERARTADTLAREERSRASELDAVRAPLDRLARAIASGERAQMQGAFPGISQRQLTLWEQTVFRQAAQINNATANVTNPRISGDRAEVDVTMVVSFTYRESLQPGTSRARYLATLARSGGGWSLVRLEER
jgi:hypothetical protein